MVLLFITQQSQYRTIDVVERNKTTDGIMFLHPHCEGTTSQKHQGSIFTLQSFKKNLKSHLYPLHWLCFTLVPFCLCFIFVSWSFDMYARVCICNSKNWVAFTLSLVYSRKLFSNRFWQHFQEIPTPQIHSPIVQDRSLWIIFVFL